MLSMELCSEDVCDKFVFLGKNKKIWLSSEKRWRLA